jgi:ubiquinone/menaquinone biosynthesis C-methylase UbiE
MKHIEFNEAEIQALITLAQLAYPVENPNDAPHEHHPQTLVEAQTYFRRFALDLAPAFAKLEAKGMLTMKVSMPALTESGKPAADELRILRPPIYYWYREFYSVVEQSAAFDQYAKMVFGMNFNQHGFSDISQINLMLTYVRLGNDSNLLDIGCGNGKMAEYISEQTGCQVTGIDYVPEAIDSAIHRTQYKRDRLKFELMNLEHLTFPDRTFDAIVSVDTIFFGRNMDDTIAGLCRVLKNTGRITVFNGDYQRDQFLKAISKNRMTIKSYDLTREHIDHMLLKHKVASKLHEAFKAEGNEFIWNNIMAESFANADAIHNLDFNPKARFLDVIEKMS